MRRRLGLVCVCIGAAFLMLASAVSGADDPKRQEPTEVVMRSLDTNLVIDGRVINTRRRFLRYWVEQVKGDSLLLIAEEGPRGWAKRQDVVPVDQAIAYFSEVVAREPRSAWAHYLRGASPAAAPTPAITAKPYTT